jgi:HEAT repeat protein
LLNDKRVQEHNLKWAVIHALGHIDDVRVLEALIPELYGSENWRTIYAISGMSDEKALNILLELIKDNNLDFNVMYHVIRAIKNQGEKAIPPLLKLLDENDDNLKTRITEALSYISGKEDY